MIKIILILFLLLWNKIPLSRFQFLLLICLLEIKTGILIGDYYWFIIFLGYLIWKWSWYNALRPRSSVRI